MRLFKIDGSCIYSDTESVVSANKLDAKIIGSELGLAMPTELMKDELKGLIIK